MKKSIKKLTSAALAMGISFVLGVTAYAASDAAYTKNENVYVRLEQDGDISGVYVVNTFRVTKKGEITDYGDYDKIQNLTNLDIIESDKDEHTFIAEEGTFYYQGDIVKAELPWNFDIVYTLDGEEVDNNELAGQEGELEIRMKIRKNPAFTDESFFQAYMLQASFTLDPKLCDNISANGVVIGEAAAGGEQQASVQTTVTDAGANENITFIVYPGVEADVIVTADIQDFEMDDISINATAATAFPKSYVSNENKAVEKTTFIISAEGVAILEATVSEAPTEEPNFFDKLADLFKSLFE